MTELRALANHGGLAEFTERVCVGRETYHQLAGHWTSHAEIEFDTTEAPLGELDTATLRLPFSEAIGLGLLAMSLAERGGTHRVNCANGKHLVLRVEPATDSAGVSYRLGPIEFPLREPHPETTINTWQRTGRPSDPTDNLQFSYDEWDRRPTLELGLAALTGPAFAEELIVRAITETQTPLSVRRYGESAEPLAIIMEEP